MPKVCLPLLALLLLLAGCGSPPAETRATRAELRGESPLVEEFRAAERESGVPAEILATIAEVQTRLVTPVADGHDHDHDSPHAPREWGLMAIGTGGLVTLDNAATLIGLPPERVASEPRANIRAAAAVLKTLAHARGIEPEAGLQAWTPAIEAYGGDALAREVVARLGRGWRGKDEQGLSVEVLPAAISEELEEIGAISQALGYPGAIWNPAYSGNYTTASRGAAQINYIVIHTVQGSYAGCISWFKNSSSKVSAHYVVRSSDGQITQMVDDKNVAWHDACFNSQSIGIEHEGYISDPGRWYTDAMYKASAKLTSWLCDQYGIPKTRAHIMGHVEAPDCSDHTDPGSGWNWNYYMELVKNGGCAPQPEVCNGKDDDCDGQVDEDGVCNQPPKGYLDVASCDEVGGWAQDPDAPASAIDVHVYFGGSAGSGAPGKRFSASRPRDDLCAALGSCEHAFRVRPPLSLLDGQPHAIHAYGIDSAGGANAELASSPKQLACATPAVSGVRRHVIDPDSFAAWKLDLFWQKLPLGDEAIAALEAGEPLPAQPALVQADDGSPEVWLVDGQWRRHVPSTEAMADWGFSFGDVAVQPAADVLALKEGPPLRPYPALLQTSDGRVELVDDPFPVEPEPFTEPRPGTGSGGSGAAPGSGGPGLGSGGGAAAEEPAGQRTRVVSNEEVEGSCSCRQSGAPAPAGSFLWLLAGALLLGRRRRS
jgi:MYXO-CTERM domain-containing protein